MTSETAECGAWSEPSRHGDFGFSILDFGFMAGNRKSKI
jgi:hypothetical protein